MSDSGTVEHGLDEDVAESVPDLEAVLAENKELRSRIGKQTNVFHDRVESVRTELMAELTKERELRAQAEREARRQAEEKYMKSLSPTERASHEVQTLKRELDELKSERVRDRQLQEEREFIQGLVAEAKRKGYDWEKIRTDSAQSAVIDFDTAKTEYLEHKIAELESRTSTERAKLTEDVIDTVRAVSGSRKIASGTPTPAHDPKIPAEIKVLADEYDRAVARKDKVKAMQLLDRAARLGYELSISR